MRRQGRRAVAFGSLALSIVLAAACGGRGVDGATTELVPPTVPAEPATTVEQRAPTSAPSRTTTTTEASTTTTEATATTSTTTTTTSTTTTSAATTTTFPVLPQPIAPPLEDGSLDPLTEIGSIEIQRIGLLRTLQEGIRLATFDRGPGHWPGSAMPGEIGNVVVGGHRVSKRADFRDLDQLQPRDTVVFTTGSGRFVYEVTSVEIVGPEALWIVDQTYDPTATLFACHPPGSTRERIVVHLTLVP